MIKDPGPVDQVTVTLKELLQIEHCPRAWRTLDLYLVRGGTIATATAAGGAEVRIVKVFNSGKKEYVEISNRGSGPQEMSGWSVSGSRGDDRFYFPNGYVLEGGATVRLHSGEDGVDAPPGDVYWTTKTVWNNDGETVCLWDGEGKVVSEYRY